MENIVRKTLIIWDEIIMSEKQKIVIIGATDFQNQLILKAKELGYETHVFAWEAGDVGEKTADYFYPISIVEKEQILEVCRKIQPVAICSIASDLAVLTVGYVARALGLTANSEQCDKISTNKYEMRRAFQNAGIDIPKYQIVRDTKEKTLLQFQTYTFPVIVKPTDRSGSRAITKLESMDGLKDAINRAIEQSFEGTAMVEEFLQGKEYSCESISYKGEHQLLAVTEKYTTGEPNYIETGHIEPALLNTEEMDNVEKAVNSGLDALDIQYGASHAEIMIDNEGKISIVEIGARMGGDCIGSDLVELSTGNDFKKMVIDVACGKQPDQVKRDVKTNAAVRFLMNERDRDLLETAKQELNVIRVSEIDKEMDHKVVDSSSRFGYFIVTDNNGDKIRKLLFEGENSND